MKIREIYMRIPEFISILSYFPEYSFGNQRIIMETIPKARMIKTAQGWRRYDRYIRMGEKPIKMIVPNKGKTSDTEFHREGFYDISQTTVRSKFARIVNPEPYRRRKKDFYDKIQKILEENSDSLMDEEFTDGLISSAASAVKTRILADTSDMIEDEDLLRFYVMTGASAVMRHYSKEYIKEITEASKTACLVSMRYDQTELMKFLVYLSKIVNGEINEIDYFLSVYEDDSAEETTAYKEKKIC